MSLDKEYEEAKKLEPMRAVFLKRIPLEDISRFAQILYEPRQAYSQDYEGIRLPIPAGVELRPVRMFNSMFLIPFRKVKLSVYPFAFSEAIPSLNHFLNILVDHEGHHAKQLWFKPYLIQNREKLELDAHWNQIVCSEKRGLPAQWRNQICEIYFGRNDSFSL
jgi:hypothetical protein